MNGEDVGGQEFEHEDWLNEIERIQGIKEDRKWRVSRLSGKYVVITKGFSSGETVFLQDRKVNSGGYWTKFLSNAKGFECLKTAKLIASGYKYGNPRVAIVESRGSYRYI